MTEIFLEATHKLNPLQVINKNELPYILPIKLSEGWKLSWRLYEVVELTPTYRVIDNFNEIFTVVPNRPWVDAKSSGLNTVAGYHKYRLSLIDATTDIVTFLYFGYQIQDDNPDKPYIYMNREESDS